LNDTSIDEILLIADDSGTFNNGKLVKYDESRKSNVIRKTPMTVSAMSGGRISKLPTPFTSRSPNPNATTTVKARLVYLSNQDQEKSKESFSLDSLQHHQQKSEETNPIEKTNANTPVSSVQANIDRIRERINLITNSRNASQTSKVLAVRGGEGGENETSFELMQTPQPDLIAEDDDEVEKQMKAKPSSNSGKSKSHKIFDIYNCLDFNKKEGN
jgi:hypothetical protein